MPSRAHRATLAACAYLQGRGIFDKEVVVDTSATTSEGGGIIRFSYTDEDLKDRCLDIEVTPDGITEQGVQGKWEQKKSVTRADALVLFSLSWLYAEDILPAKFRVRYDSNNGKSGVMMTPLPDLVIGGDFLVIVDEASGIFWCTGVL